MVTTLTPIGREIGGGRARPGLSDPVNVGNTERWLSLAGGGLLALYGLQKENLTGLGWATLGGALLYRGLTGHCSVYASLGRDSAQRPHGPAASVRAGHGVKVERAITINRPAEELFRFWRDFQNLPRFMKHLERVTLDGNRSHWVARAPAGFTIEWDAEIINEEQGRLIAWRSLQGSEVDTAGSVHFTEAPGGRGTEVHVSLKYDPPGGKLGSWVAWAFGEEPGQQIQGDLRRFKQLMEAGEIPTIEGQPSCRR